LPFKLVTTKQGFVVEPPLRDWRFAAVMSSAALALLVLSWRRAVRISAPSGTTVALSRLQNIQRARVFIFVAIGYALWVKVFTYYRYVVPLEMCSGIVTMACICAVFRGSRARVFVGLAITAIVLATTTYPRWGRAPFATKAIDVSIPRIAPRSLVLFTDHQPAGYLIPFFPSDARFIAPWWTLGDPRFVDFTNPRYTNLLQQRINDTIAGHDGPLYAVGLDRRIGGPSSNKLRGTKEAILREYGLIEEPNSCEQIKSNLDNSALDICRLQRDRGGHQTAVQ
jgi:hypothetical protein